MTVMCCIPALFLFQWFSSHDEEGRVYFFEENSNESTWTLPDDSNAGCDVSTAEGMNILLKQMLILCHLYVLCRVHRRRLMEMCTSMYTFRFLKSSTDKRVLLRLHTDRF